MEDNSNEDYFNYLDTVPLEVLYKEDLDVRFKDYLISRYKSGKYNHRDILYLAIIPSTYHKKFTRVHMRDVILQIILNIMNKNNIREDIYTIVNCFKLWNEFNSKWQLYGMSDIHISRYCEHISIEWLVELILSRCEPIEIIFHGMYFRNIDKLKSVLASFEDKDKNNIFTSFIAVAQLGSVTPHDDIKIINLMIEMMKIDLSSIKSDDNKVMRFIEELKKEGV